MGANEIEHEWRFTIGEAFPADSPVARFIVAVAQAMNDNLLANSLFVGAKRPYEHIYFFNLACSHLYEAAETLRQAHREWQEVQDFVASLDAERRQDFEKITSLADPGAGWPGNRVKEIRNSFFHYLRLDRAAAKAGELPVVAALTEAATMESNLVIERGGPLNGIRALFADEVYIKALTASFEDDELERLAKVVVTYQPRLNYFAQAAVGHYLRGLPRGVVRSKED